MKNKKTIAILALSALTLGASLSVIGTNVALNDYHVSIADNNPPVTPTTTQNYLVGKNHDLIIPVDFRNQKLNSVKEGSALLRAQTNYVYNNSSFILKAAYLDGLSKTTHTFTLSTDGGEASVNVAILENMPIPPASGAPIISTTSFEFEKGRLSNISIPVDYNGGTLLSVSQGIKNLNRGEDYIYNGTTLEIKNLYLDSLAYGTYQFSLTTNGGSASFSITVKQKSSPTTILPPALATTSFSYYQGHNLNLNVVVDLKGQNVTQVENGSVILTHLSDYTVEENKIVITYNYLDALSAGNYDFRIVTAGGDATFHVTVVAAGGTVAPGEAPSLTSNTYTYTLGNSNDIVINVDFHNEALVTFKRGDDVLAMDDDYYLSSSAITLPNATLEALTAGTYAHAITTRSGSANFDLIIKPEDTTGKLPRHAAADVYNLIYTPLDKDTLPLGGYFEPAQDYGNNTNAQYLTVKESGLNTIYAVLDNYSGATNAKMQGIYNALEYASENDIAYFVRHKGIATYAKKGDAEFIQEVNKFIGYKSFGGFMAFDEPSEEEFEAIKPLSDKMRQFFPEKNAYLNLFPIEATSSALNKHETISWDTYVQRYIDQVNPRYISYDSYPKTNGSSDSVTQPNNHFYELNVLRNKCNAAHIPFYFYVCCTRHFDVDIPITDAYLSWCINTALAYGAKGITYFTYQIPDTSGGPFADNGTGYINRGNGQKTAVYDICKGINMQIKEMDRVLVNSHVEKIMTVGSGTPATLYGASSFSATKELASCSASSGRALISVMNYGGKTAFYVVNNSLTSNATINLGFTNNVVANKFTYDGTTTINATSDSVTLAPGRCALYEITNYVRG